MIEYPESTTLAKQMKEILARKVINKVVANQSPHKYAWFSGEPSSYHDLLRGKKVIGTASYGGMVELQFDDMHLVFADGTNVRYLTKGETLPKKHQLYIEFMDQSCLVCSVQMYGALWLLSSTQTEGYYEIAKSKIDPLSEEFDEDYFLSLYEDEDSKLSAKAYLATKQRIPGLGNGVLQDILFNAKIHPKRKMITLSDDEHKSMYQSVKNTLLKMTEIGGRDTEKNLFGEYGGYITILSKKTLDTPCPICGNRIVREAYLGGKIYFCPECQKLEK